MLARIILLFGVFAAVACGQKDPPPPSPEPAPATNEKSAQETNPESVAAAKPQKPEAKKITGKAYLRAVPDAGAPIEGEVNLTFGARDEVTGTLAISDSRLELRGIREKDNLRLWTVSENRTPEQVRRGYLFARLQDEKYQGEIAISGNGAVPVLRGTWSAD